MNPFILALILLFFFKISIAQFIGNGKDGSPEIAGIINNYTGVTTDIQRCQKKIFVKNNSGFSIGDLVLIIQMQGAKIDNTNTLNYGTLSAYVDAGNYEYALIDSVDGNNVVFLKNPVLRNFSSAGKTQLIRVPQYNNPVISGTITCKKWDGETGGVVVFDAFGSVIFNSHINVNGKGFRGAQKMKGEHFFAFSHDYIGESYDPNWYSLKGEGIAFNGVLPFTSGRGAPANGGGGGNIHTAGGGGGGNLGCGGKGGWGYPVDTLGNQYDSQGIGGYPLNYSTSENKIFLGGGGGAGHEHFNNGSGGGDGAGMVIITAGSISGNSKMIMANGSNSASSGAYGDGTGGAGAGGTIILSVNNFTDTLFVSIKGGDGGSSIMKGFGPGGGGGGGILCLSSANIPGNIVISSLSGGTAGVAGGNYYGAESGCNGGVQYNTEIPFNNYYEGVNAGFTFFPSYLSSQNNSVSFNNTTTGAAYYQWNFGDESSDDSPNPTHIYDGLGNYIVRLTAKDSICSDTATADISGRYIPNVFTPDGDGLNDYFSFAGLDSAKEAELIIFNRWGEVVFTENSGGEIYELRWDGTFHGKPLPEATYYYVVRYTLFTDEKKSGSGYLMLMR